MANHTKNGVAKAIDNMGIHLEARSFKWSPGLRPFTYATRIEPNGQTFDST
jgi:hypothetical protein